MDAQRIVDRGLDGLPLARARLTDDREASAVLLGNCDLRAVASMLADWTAFLLRDVYGDGAEAVLSDLTAGAEPS